jgi:hypothetical protein
MVQRKVFTPNDFQRLQIPPELEQRLLAFERRYEGIPTITTLVALAVSKNGVTDC